MDTLNVLQMDEAIDTRTYTATGGNIKSCVLVTYKRIIGDNMLTAICSLQHRCKKKHSQVLSIQETT